MHVNARGLETKACATLQGSSHKRKEQYKSIRGSFLFLCFVDIFAMGQYWELINIDRREVFPNRRRNIKMGGMIAVFTELVDYLIIPTRRTVSTLTKEEVHWKSQTGV